MTQTIKLTYNVREINRASVNYGMIMQKTRKFTDFTEAATFSRQLANTVVNLIGMPIIDLTEK